MNKDEHERLDFLRTGQCVPVAYVEQFYGLHWPFQGALRDDFEIWRRQATRKDCAEGMVSRYQIEGFMHRSRVVSAKWMAAELGMTCDSFHEVFARVEELGLRPARYRPYPELISLDFRDDLIPALPSLRFRTFGDNNAYCERLHDDLHETLGIDIQPLWCATSLRVGDERQYARYFDCLTLEPLSVKHLMWLDFKKPLYLSPDRCSKLFFAKNYDELSPFRAGTAEPPGLDWYQAFLAGNPNG
ncbi:MAG TPA: hypothetical protein VEI07_20060 [Planctomycetaceae bacterium]|nr:hypothetical protein [Planctomycetaceae bacterium]